MVPRFTHPAFHSTTFDAVRYGDTWNGFATPIVDRATLEELLDVLDDNYVRGWVDGEDVLRVEYFDGRGRPGMFDDVSPLPDGTYDLGRLGWTFELAEDPVVDDVDPLTLLDASHAARDMGM
ncbi:hypothetical protein [Xylanimonas ulmi]|uniref:Uncharacterized protein n=1 Tax=Xylanimonas ulmi TaxID=228973 RepID=A0A4Q7M5H2_9MICO|nr:hypothetical protein [Xylanibacterium ulmi]RZS62227.1 hypothetical protein EV386_2551 [Xylanibacterium ulmi]